MAGFCANCGFSLGNNAAFCPQCGAKAAKDAAATSAQSAPLPQQPAAYASTPAYTQGPPPGARKSGSGLKILLVVLGVFVFFGIAALGVLFYVGHRVKQAVEEKAATYGVDLHPDSTASSGPIHSSYAACALATKEEVGQALGVQIAKSEQRGRGVTSTCDYYPAAPPSDQAVASEVDKLKQLGNDPSSDAKNGTTQDALSKMAKATLTDPSAPVITVEVNGDGRSNMAAFAGAMRLMSGIAKGAGAGIKVSEDLSGIGERAVFGATGQMMFLKGNTSVQLSGPGILGSKSGAIALARTIAPRL